MSLAWIQASLTFAALLYLLLPVRRLSPVLRLASFAALLALAQIPWDGLPLAGYLRGVIGELAITTLVLLVWSAVRRSGPWSRPEVPDHWLAAAFFVLMGVVLYPATLGLSGYDPYRLGYQPDWLLGICALACCAFLLQRLWVFALGLMLATLAFLVELKDTRNYWEYILDPVLWIYGVAVVVARLTSLAWSARAATRAPALASGGKASG